MVDTNRAASRGQDPDPSRHQEPIVPLDEQTADEICAALDARTVTLPAEQTWVEIIGYLVGDLERICSRRDQLAVTIEEVFLSHPLGAVLVTLCGFGPGWS